MSELLRERVVTTRKAHNCCWCGEPIEVGKRNIACRSWAHDGCIFTGWFHPECNGAWRNTNWGYFEDGFLFGECDRGVPMHEM